MERDQRTWILVADAGTARVYLRERPNAVLKAVADAKFDNPAAHGHARDLGTDRPARSIESVGMARHAIEPRIDLHRQVKANFAARLASFLEQAAAARKFDGLVLIAPPQMLGDLRAALGERSAACLAGALAKDLTKAPVAIIDSQLASVLQP